jgi:Protein kinase domain
MPGLVGEMLGPYRLVEQVGKGGMATVYRGLDTRDVNEVAIKVLSPTISADKRFVRRFRREAGLVSRLKHPGIVPVTDYGEARGFVYLVMPYVQGDTLHDRMVKGRLNQDEVARWIGQVASALQFAHDQGVIHRDVKPSNIMIARTGNALLTDFGLARVIEGGNTLTGSMLMGTPAYVSPEQGRGQHTDPRSDQYSLGVILYQMTAGRLPFDSDTPMSTVLMHIQDAVPRIRRFNPSVSPALEQVILRALEKQPGDRFQDVSTFNEAFQATVGGGEHPSAQPTRVLPRPLVKRDGSGGRRWIWAAIGLGGLGLLVLGGVTYPNWLNPPPTMPATIVVVAPIAPPTWTPAPTPAPTEVVSAGCPELRLIGFRREGNAVVWTIDNATGAAVKVSSVDLGMPESNSVTSIQIGGAELSSPSTGSSTGTPQVIQVAGAASMTLQPGQTKPLRLVFQWPDAQPGYRLDLGFDGGCMLATRW